MKDRIVTHKNIMYGELLEVASLTGNKEKPYDFNHGYHTSMKVHYFNKKGVFLGNLYEFVKYDRVRFRACGKHVWARNFMYYRKSKTYRDAITEFILQSIYEMKCRIVTILIRTTYYD